MRILNAFTDAEKTKLTGIPAGTDIMVKSTYDPTAINANAFARANHTGDISASVISDFDIEVDNNPTVSANTSKVTNATHTGEVTGSGVLTVDSTAISNKALITGASGQEILINDAGTLKKVNAGDFIGGGSVFGNGWQSEEDTTFRSVNNTTFQLGQRMTTPSLPAGTYRIAFLTIHRINSSSQEVGVRVQVNNSTTLFGGQQFNKEQRDSNSGQREHYGGFDYHTDSGVLNIDIDFKSSSGGNSAELFYTRIEIWRVS